MQNTSIANATNMTQGPFKYLRYLQGLLKIQNNQPQDPKNSPIPIPETNW